MMLCGLPYGAPCGASRVSHGVPLRSLRWAVRWGVRCGVRRVVLSVANGLSRGCAVRRVVPACLQRLLHGEEEDDPPGCCSVFGDILRGIRQMPSGMTRVCVIQVGCDPVGLVACALQGASLGAAGGAMPPVRDRLFGTAPLE